MAASLLIGAVAAQSSWYPRSTNYTTSGYFIGAGLNISGDGYIGGNHTVVGDQDVEGDVNVMGDIYSDGGAYLSGNLSVGGTIASSDTTTIYDYLGDIANITTTANDVAAAINELDGDVLDLWTNATTQYGEIGNFSAVTNVTSNESISAVLDELAARIAVLETSG